MEDIEPIGSAVTPAYRSKDEEEKLAQAKTESSHLEQIMEKERGAFSVASAQEPALKSPKGHVVVKFDTSKLLLNLEFYCNSMWDGFLEQIAKQRQEAHIKAIKDTVKHSIEDSTRLADEMVKAKAISDSTVQNVINLAILFMLFNPINPEIAVEKVATHHSIAKEMTQAVTLFLANPDHMASLRTALSLRVATSNPDMQPSEKEHLVNKAFLTVRVAMTFAALSTFSIARSDGQQWTLTLDHLRKGSFEGIAEGLQNLLLEDLPQLEKLMGAPALNAWLEDLAKFTILSSKRGMEMVFSYLQTVAQSITPPEGTPA